MPMGAPARPSQLLADDTVPKRLKIHSARHAPETAQDTGRRAIHSLLRQPSCPSSDAARSHPYP